MKKTVCLLLCGVLMMGFASCEQNKPPVETSTPAATATPEELVTIAPSEADVVTQKWVAAELAFETETSYSGSRAFELVFDVVFTNRSSGTSLKIPGFYDGDKTFRVRFAPTETGFWDYKTVCADDPALDGKTGTVGAESYTGDLEIYKHGFIKTEQGKKYFVYDDGTPFFYLGDTHWTMYSEKLEDGEDSHFKYLVNKRVAQGFTVYQSEPINAPFNVADRLTSSDISGFQKADKYYRYLAEKGLVHANAEFFFPTNLTEKLAGNEEYLKTISRYWVARFGAYPVLWTLAQEIDSTGYEQYKTDRDYYQHNDWVKIATYIHEADAYAHPLTGHQMFAEYTTVTGSGTDLSKPKTIGRGISAFHYEETVKNNYSHGHSWWASQWKPELKERFNVLIPKDYWASPKVAINYESRYCNFQTKDFGARAQGYISFLSGMYGYGYGATDIWAYRNTWLMTNIMSDGVEEVTPEDKALSWKESVDLPSALQVGYMRQFFEKIAWWDLVPDFYDGNAFSAPGYVNYVCAHKDNELYVVYFYGASLNTGTVKNMDASAVYTATWFDPQTNTYTLISDAIKPAGGTYEAPQHPTSGRDWVLLITKNS